MGLGWLPNSCLVGRLMSHAGTSTSAISLLFRQNGGYQFNRSPGEAATISLTLSVLHPIYCSTAWSRPRLPTWPPLIGKTNLVHCGLAFGAPLVWDRACTRSCLVLYH